MKEIEALVGDIIEQYASTLFLSFITLVVTSFVLNFVKDFIIACTYFLRAKFSDIGYGQRIMWQSGEYIVGEIKFSYLELHDENKTIRLPLKIYLDGPTIFPRQKIIPSRKKIDE